MNPASKAGEPRAFGEKADTEEGTRLVLVEKRATHEEAVYARVAPAVNRLLWAFLGPDPDRDDLAHDIFIRIFRGAPLLRDSTRLEAWAARVAINHIKNEFRRRRLRRWLSLEPYAETALVSYHSDFEGRELVIRTQQLLRRLPINERMPFTLQLLHGTSLEELAQLCECSIRTIKRRLKSARERFARMARLDPVLASRLSLVTGTKEQNDA